MLTYISSVNNTPTMKKLDHHDADELAGQKLGRPLRPPREDANTPYKTVFITLNIFIF
jgi:hypothetical protein